MLKNYYNLIMSSETNGLAELPNMVKFQLNDTYYHLYVVYSFYFNGRKLFSSWAYYASSCFISNRNFFTSSSL